MQQRELEEQLREALARPGQALDAAMELLARLRPMHPSGARLVLKQENDMGALVAQGPEATAELAARLLDLARAERCLGCGTCCLASSPTLYAEDLKRLSPEGLPRRALYALRAGERVSSAREGGSRILERELIKLREGRSGQNEAGLGCRFLEAGRCQVYEARPLQCRVLECWSGRHAGHLAGQPRLRRVMLFEADETALALMAEYDLKLPALEMTQALQATAQGDAQASSQALAMLELDHNLRSGVSQRYGYSADDLDLMWGRSAVLVARSHGLELMLNQEGRVVLQSLRADENLQA